jgi:ribonuclease Z
LQFKLKILGVNSAAPAHNRHQTSQVLIVNNQHFLIDCGENTQVQLMKYKIKAQKINHIFISHLHGDHYLGLMGLLSTMHLLGRKTDLHIYGPKGLDEIITVQLKHAETILQYKLVFHLLEQSHEPVQIFENDLVTVHTLPLEHRISCNGFLFREKPKSRRVIKELLPESLNIRQIGMLKKGFDIVDDDGKVIYKNEEFTLPPKKSRSYAFCSDTKFKLELVPFLREVDLLYHEATFLEEFADRAITTFHSTAKQAATIAKEAGVGKLIMGHFSIRYKDLAEFNKEAREVFADAHIGVEGQDYEVEDL